MLRHDDAVVHPCPLTARLHDARASQIGQVSRNFRLRLLQDFDEVADSHFLVAHEIEETKARVVAERLEETFHVEDGLPAHGLNIYVLTHVLNNYIFA